MYLQTKSIIDLHIYLYYVKCFFLSLTVNPKPAGLFTTPSGATVPSTTPNTGPFNCNFDQNLCSWTQDKTDNFDWIRKTGSTATANTGPTSGHLGSKPDLLFVTFYS